MPSPLSGVIAAVATPLTENLQPDAQALAQHCKQLLADGCSHASVFGTTGEANSFSASTRMKAIEDICKQGVDPKTLVPGTGAAALEDTITITRHAAELGVSGLLILPPFYYPEPSLEGLIDYFRPLGEIAGKAGVPIIYYNFPRMTKVPASTDLIKALRGEFGKNVFAGVKDSSGDWAQTSGYLEIGDGFLVFPGNENMLPQAVPLGAAGCITGSANVSAPYVKAAYDELLETGADGPAQQRAWKARAIIDQFNLLPAQKFMLHDNTGNPAWSRLVPPLRTLEDAQGQAFIEAFNNAIAD